MQASDPATAPPPGAAPARPSPAAPGAPAVTPELRELVGVLFAVVRATAHAGSPGASDTGALRLLGQVAAACPARPSDIAASTRLDLSTVSRHLRSLEASGLVVRDPDPDDRRAARVALSAHGREVLAEVREAKAATLARALVDWGAADRAALLRLLRRLADDLGSIPCPRETP